MEKPIIGISSEMLDVGLDFRPTYKIHIVNQDYRKLVEREGALPIIIPISEDLDLVEYYVDLCDGILFTGGADINPVIYKQDPDHSLSVTDYKRDLFEVEMMKVAIEKDKPILGICRGMQILNIARGGDLIQNIPDMEGSINHMVRANKDDISHIIEIEKDNLLYNLFGSSLMVNSAHHQAIGKLGKNIEILARAKDGIIEAIRLKNKKFIYGVQWHPEELVYSNRDMGLLIREFLKISRK